VLFCNEQGVDVIVTDHHLPGKEIPKAHAVVNPKQEDCIYPDPMLCGSGVAFKLVQAFLKRYGEIYKILPGQEKWLLDMVGLATLSDMVPLVNENRVFAHYGLMVFRKTRRPGLVHLLKKAGLRSDMLTEDDLTFTVSPRINAAGRMDHPRHAYQLLATKDKQEAEEKSLLLHDYNLSRKNLVKTVIKQAKAKLEARKDHTLIVVGDRTWPVGIVGLVASRLVEEYGRPAFVWGGGEDDTILKGSCRSDGSINMVELMSSCKNSFVSFGGHELAGGFAVSLDAIHFLESELSDSYENLKTEISRTPVYSYDMDLSFDEVTPELYDQVSKLAPFGVGNPKPIFLFRDSAIEKLRLFGKHNEHLELTFRSESGRYVKAIAFFKNHESFGEMLREGSQVQLFASLEKSYFGYKTEFRLRIEAIHVS
jgi:single-stranded-DNA-specific exonuclease